MLPRELNVFCFMTDHKAFALSQRVFHILPADFDFQDMTAVRERKPKYSIVLRRTTWRE